MKNMAVKRIEKSLELLDSRISQSGDTVYGFLLVSQKGGKDYFDLHGDHVPDTVIEKIAEHIKNVPLLSMHKYFDPEIKGPVGHVVSSFPLTKDLADSFGIKTDTYGLIISAKVTNPAVLEAVKAGLYTGFSIGFYITGEMDREGDLSDYRFIVEDSFPLEVSLVDRPAQEPATFRRIKQAPENKGKNMSVENEQISDTQKPAPVVSPITVGDIALAVKTALVSDKEQGEELAELITRKAKDLFDVEYARREECFRQEAERRVKEAQELAEKRTQEAVAKLEREDRVRTLAAKLEGLGGSVDERITLAASLVDSPEASKIMVEKAENLKKALTTTVGTVGNDDPAIEVKPVHPVIKEFLAEAEAVAKEFGMGMNEKDSNSMAVLHKKMLNVSKQPHRESLRKALKNFDTLAQQREQEVYKEIR